MGQESGSPHRRDLLRAGAGAVASSALGATASASRNDTDAYAPRGELDISGAAEAVVTPDGESAFVAVGTGFVSVDLSDPANPAIVSERAALKDPDGVAVQGVLDVKYDAGQLLVPTAAQGGGPKGFYLFDVSDPANPTQVGDWFPTPGHGNHNSFLLDGVAYLTGNTQDGPKIDMVDVSADSFERVGTWQPGDWKEGWKQAPFMVLHDLYVQEGYAYCAYWDGGTFIVDVSDPADPSFVSRVGDYGLEEMQELTRADYTEPEGNDHYVQPDEDATLMAEGGESWDTDPDDDSGGPSGITLYDISDKASPERLGHIDPPVSASNAYRGGTWTTSHNFDIRDGRLYASWYQGGVSVHDISDPANPERVAWWASPSDRAFWTAQMAVSGDYFVTSTTAEVSGTKGGLLTFPDTSGEMSEPPSAVAWSREDLSGSETTTTTTAPTTAAPTTAEPTTASTTKPTTEPTDDSGAGSTATDSDGSPGFGVLAALGGLGLGAARLLRGDDA